MIHFLDVDLLVLSVPALAATGYLLLLTLFSRRRVWPGRPAAPRRMRFDVVVPAHDEEKGIARTVRSLLALDWPGDRFRVVVVADNCSDRTAGVARDAGATVWERTDPDRRGKGPALNFAFGRAAAEGRADAVAVVDADSVPSRNLLGACAARLEAGAQAVQVRYAVLNPGQSWRTRLMSVAFALFHDVRSLGRERLGLSCGLRGNGMCFAVDVLRRVPHDVESIVEDLEYGIRLGEAWIRVWYAHEAQVLGEMAAGGPAVATQRRRWEGGRAAIRRLRGPSLLFEGLRLRDRIRLDLAADLYLPPLAWTGAGSAVGAVSAATLSRMAGRPLPSLFSWLVACLFLSAHVFRGVWLSGQGLRGLTALLWTPVYLVSKVVLLVTSGRRPPREWVRTARGPADPGPEDPPGPGA